jgi:hypothetical protein
VLVRLRVTSSPSSRLVVIAPERVARQADVLAVGSEVRDLKTGDVVIINSAAGSHVGDDLLVPEAAVLGTLP